jgi:PKD repeat protein
VKSATYADLKKGDRIELGGLEYIVDKAKAKGKKVALTVTGKRGTFSSEVKAKDAVTIAKPPKLDGPNGEQQRWATEKEAAEFETWNSSRPTSAPAGNPEQTKRPAKATGNPWDAKGDATEDRLETLLGARLAGESTDENAGYYVPPVDVQTVAAHLLIFHGVKGDQYTSAEEALVLHSQHHADAKFGAAMLTNHWHTKVRP